MSDSHWLRNTVNPSVQDTIRKLDHLLCQLDGFTPILEQSARYAANEIKLNFDAIFDALSEQKRKLLRQLDQVIRDKSINISSQKQSIEAIRNALITHIATGCSFDSQMQDCISRAETITLSPSSVPFVSFRNNISLLDRAIMGYGQIISRYCGHFADPSLPSTCLPLEVEEEEESDHAAIAKQDTAQYSCIDPSIRQWLLYPSDTNTSKKTLTACTSSRKASCNMFRNTDNVDSIHHNFTDSRQWSNVHQCLHPRSPYSTKPCDLHTWLDQAQRPVGTLFARKVSNSFTTVDSDPAESFVALNDSPGTSVNLKEWLFSDPMDTDDMPGLSNVAKSSCPNWKKPMYSTPADIEDLSKWLITPTNSNVGAMARENPANIGGDDSYTREDNDDIVSVSCPTSDCGSVVLHTIESEPTSDSTITGSQSEVNVKEKQADYDCIYTQCCGGPGGPTCCGGRPPRPSDNSPAAPKPVNVEAKGNVGRLTSSMDGKLTFQGDIPSSNGNRLSVSRSAVIEQLNSIANSNWRQWLASSCGGKPMLKRTFSAGHSESRENSRWLVSSEQSMVVGFNKPDDVTELHDPVHSDPTNTVFEEPTPKKQMDQSLGADYECWLMNKLHACMNTGQSAPISE